LSIRGRLISILAPHGAEDGERSYPALLAENMRLKEKLQKTQRQLKASGGRSAADDDGSLLSLKEDQYTYIFHCDTEKERRRAKRLFTKEKGTVNWIARDARPGDTFFDVGANIGLYTVYAAARIGNTGSVFAFEPHGVNFAALIKTIVANGFTDFVHPVSLPLGDTVRFGNFNYQSILASSSTSQFEGNSYEGKEFVPSLSELKYCVTVDHLIEQGVLAPADMVKIDVDGLDFEVLKGMEGMLRDSKRPRSLQVELGTDSMGPTLSLLDDIGYRVVEKHWTEAGLAHIERGLPAESYPHYAICWPVDRKE
jgi:FkbM family methyltransferase